MKQHHPDKSKDNGDKFKQVQQAYDTLNDPSKKQAYLNQERQSPNPGSGGSTQRSRYTYEDVFREAQRQRQRQSPFGASEHYRRASNNTSSPGNGQPYTRLYRDPFTGITYRYTVASKNNPKIYPNAGGAGGERYSENVETYAQRRMKQQRAYEEMMRQQFKKSQEQYEEFERQMEKQFGFRNKADQVSQIPVKIGPLPEAAADEGPLRE